MPKNKGKGGKNRRRGKNENESQKRELIYKTECQEYALVEALLGNGRLRASCFDGVKRMCHIRGKLRKKCWINSGDIVLLGLRDYQDAKADVLLKYLPDEVLQLKAEGKIPETVKLEENVIEFDANAALFEADEEGSESDEEEEEEEESESDSDEGGSDGREHAAGPAYLYDTYASDKKDSRNHYRRK